MSAKKPRQVTTPQPASRPAPVRQPAAKADAGFSITMPLVWLAAVAFVLYLRTLAFDLTELDDSIFINDFREFNENIGNIFTAFHRGLFDPVKDPYYRPLFLVSMILNYLGSDHGRLLITYHFLNIVFHVISVVLLFKLFVKLNVRQTHAFILTLLFAVLPVLVQDVAWIPGRNDTMLAIFLFAFFIHAIDYADNGKPKHLLLSALFLLLAFFTKETAAFALPVAFVMLVVVLRRNWRDNKLVTQYVFWAACFAAWFLARSLSTTRMSEGPGLIAKEAFGRLPIIIVYIGKIFLPVNLSVFPIKEDSTLIFGVVVIALLTMAIIFAKGKSMRVVLGGLAIFLLFLLPALLVPGSLNKQVFEHRLYLPVIGILLILPQTVLFRNRLGDKQLLYGGIGVAVIFSVINLVHQENFKDKTAFWTNAEQTSPHSGYAKMMLAARLPKDKLLESAALFHEAYRLDSNEKYINYYIGVLLQTRDSVTASERYLLKEKNTSGYFECDFYLARVCMERKDFQGAIDHLAAFLKFTPDNEQANNNLLLLYLQTQQTDNARNQVKQMRKVGLTVPPQILQQLHM